MSGLREFFERIFHVAPTNPIAGEDDELLAALVALLREGCNDAAIVDPTFFDRKAALFDRLATYERRRAWDETDVQRAAACIRLSIRAGDTARRARRRAFELRATRKLGDAVWGGHP